MIAPSNFQPVAARWLLLLTTAGITYGSLYPFAFVPARLSPNEIFTILSSDWRNELGIPNIVANLILFIPYGLFGVLSLSTPSRVSRWLIVILTASILAFGIQAAQIWFSGRTPTIIDGFINMGGVIAGMVVARIPWVRDTLARTSPWSDHMRSLPLLLLLVWLAYRWFPLAPSLDVTALKHALKPLIMETEWRPLNFIHNLTAWLVFSLLWRHCRFHELLLWLIIPGSLVVQLFIANNPVLLHNIAAALLAPPMWSVIKNIFTRPERPLTLLLIAVLITQGLRPFEIGFSSFHWVPFYGFLTGNMMVNTSSLLEKLFLYGSLVWLTFESNRSRALALLIPVSVITAIEVAQIGITGRVAEITDPLLCILIWWVLSRESAAEEPPRLHH